MRNYRISLFVCLSIALGAIGVFFQSVTAQQNKTAPHRNVPTKEVQKPAKPATNDDEPVAVTPKNAPDTETATPKPAPTLRPDQFGNFRNPTTNSKGQVAFLGLHNAPGTSAGYGHAVFIFNPDGTWNVFRENQKLLNLKDDVISVNGISINENGDLTFVGQLAGKEPLPENPHAPNRDQFISKPFGLFLRTAEGTKVLVRLGEEVPNMPSFFSSFANSSSNSKGVTAFIGSYSDPDGKGLFIQENGKLRLIARSGQRIPTGEERVFSEHYYPSRINERGEITWFSRIGSDGGGIFVLREGKILPIAIQGKSAPVKYKDADGKEKYANFIGFGNRAPAINNKGDVVFAAFFDGLEYGRGLFLKPVDGELQLLARSGDNFAGGAFKDFNFPAINDRGEIVFVGNYGGNERGVFIRRSKGIEPVALAGQKLANGSPEDIFNQFTWPTVNDRGDVYFYGQLKNASVGIFRWDTTKGLRALVRRGDKMPEPK